MFRKAGFTLIEILIALFIFTIVSMIIVGALHTVFTSQNSTEKNASRLADLQIALTLMSRDLEQAIDRPVLNTGGTPEGAFLGLNNSITFTHGGITNPLGQEPRSSLQRARYRLEKDNLLRETWDVLDQAQKSMPSARTLLTNVTELEFQYIDQNGKSSTRWPPPDQTTNAGENLPKAVRVNINLRDLGKLSQLYVIPIQKLPPPQQPK
ncbi:MAG: type II secretion system minor pseudopilin GspJ [Gammaproteobacteria bacterium]